MSKITNFSRDSQQLPSEKKVKKLYEQLITGKSPFLSTNSKEYLSRAKNQLDEAIQNHASAEEIEQICSQIVQEIERSIPQMFPQLKLEEYLKQYINQTQTASEICALAKPIALAKPSSAASDQPYPPLFSKEQDQNLMKFLTDPSANGVAYAATAGALKGKALPLSYQTTENLHSYWDSFIPEWERENNSSVKDKTNDAILKVIDNGYVPDFASIGSGLQMERTIITAGSGQYDAATAQIAGALNNQQDFVEGIDLWHQEGYDGDQSNVNNHFQNNENGYLKDIIPRKEISEDPLKENPTIIGSTKGEIVWFANSTTTGENAWGILIGPLQSAQTLAKAKGQLYVDFSNSAVQNAIKMLPAFKKMQSPEGALFFSPENAGNFGRVTIDAQTAYIEHNASALGGFMVMRKVLQDQQFNPNLTDTQKKEVMDALDTVSTIIDGKEPTTKGIISFLLNDALSGDLEKGDLGFQTIGKIVPNDQGALEWQPNPLAKAIGCNSWSLSALGQPLIDRKKGYGASYEIFQNMVQWGGYFDALGTLKGFGYSEKDGNGVNHHPGNVLSAEWTAVAINTCRGLIQQYTDSPTNDPQKKQEILRTLRKQEKNLKEGLMSLRVGNYTTDPSYTNGRPENYASYGLNADSFLYSSKRYLIPFGWSANPLPSTAATAWAKMINDNFNPFSPNGSYHAPFSVQ